MSISVNSGSVGMGSVGSWEPINFGDKGPKYTPFLIHRAGDKGLSPFGTYQLEFLTEPLWTYAVPRRRGPPSPCRGVNEASPNRDQR